MNEWILSSSLLILLIIGLRALLRGRIRPGLQYALWLLVLVRILLPISLFETEYSVMRLLPNAVPGVEQTAANTAAAPEGVADTLTAAPPASALPDSGYTPAAPVVAGAAAAANTAAANTAAANTAASRPEATTLTTIWLCGMLAVASI